MTRKALFLNAAGLLLLFSFTLPAVDTPWGFFGHRRINRLAVFTLPAEMAGFYKKHIEYVTEHAVDPDKRRYATRHEAVRHYIDIDHWDSFPFDRVPRDWTDALAKYAVWSVAMEMGDTLALTADSFPDYAAYRSFFQEELMPQYYEDVWTCSCADLEAILARAIPGCKGIQVFDQFSSYGILPYHLLQMQRRLTRAFAEGDPKKILQLSTEMGHYIGDAHVPLHTTENYNGQLTGQEGIHAFWESRLPELFADEQYDYFVGPAEYIDDPAGFFWDIVLSSHLLLDSVLNIEKELSRTFSADLQFCYDDRLGQTVRTQCREYAEAYHRRLGGQVEARMRASILAIGSVWYTAWVDAGSPRLQKLTDAPLAGSGSPDALAPASTGEQARTHE